MEIGDKVKIHYKDMLIPARIIDKRQQYNRTEYRLELLDDGTVITSWETDNYLEPYEQTIQF